MVEKLQQEDRANEIADRAAEQAAKAPPPPPPVPWWEANWPILAAIVGMAVLVAGGLLWKRRRDASNRGADWQATTAVAPASADTISRFRKEQALRSAPAGLARIRHRPRPRDQDEDSGPHAGHPRNGRRTRRLRAVAGHRGGARLCRPRPSGPRNRCAERAHQAAARSMPAAWLMLLNLYHANGRRQEFRRVAEEFHVHFNVQTPSVGSALPSASSATPASSPFPRS